MSIQEHCNTYLAQVVLDNAGPDQRAETRKAFYTGAGIALKLMSDLAADATTEEEAVANLQELHDEMDDFMKEVEDEAKETD